MRKQSVCLPVLFLFLLLTFFGQLEPVNAAQVAVGHFQVVSTAEPDLTGTAEVTPDASPSAGQESSLDRLGNILLGAIITLGLLGAGMMAVGTFLRRNPGRDDS